MIFEITDITARKIRLTKERWNHIIREHPNVTNLYKIITTLTQPTTIKQSRYDQNVRWYYLFIKEKQKYIMVAVKYLNGHGFIITAYYLRNLK